RDVDAVGALEDLPVALDVRPQERPGRVEVGQRLSGRRDAVVVGRPPDLVRPGGRGGRDEQVAVQVITSLPGSRETAIAWQGGEGVVVHVTGEADLVQVVATAYPVRSRAYLLDRRHQQADEDSNDGDDHQQLDQREAQTSSHKGRPLPGLMASYDRSVEM